MKLCLIAALACLALAAGLLGATAWACAHDWPATGLLAALTGVAAAGAQVLGQVLIWRARP